MNSKKEIEKSNLLTATFLFFTNRFSFFKIFNDKITKNKENKDYVRNEKVQENGPKLNKIL